MEKKRYHIIVEGKVQGVFFRAYTQEEAEKLGLSGWVRNQRDRTVEAVIEGENESVEKMLQWFHRGSPHSRVSNVRVREETPQGESEGFQILY